MSLKIEQQEVLAETGRRSYELLRLSRIKYVDNPYSFIDLRLFQRGYEYEGDDEKKLIIPQKRECN